MIYRWQCGKKNTHLFDRQRFIYGKRKILVPPKTEVCFKKSVDFSSMLEVFTNTYFYGNKTYLLEN